MPVNGSFAPQAAVGGIDIELPLFTRSILKSRHVRKVPITGAGRLGGSGRATLIYVNAATEIP
jgi:hypothetical protein